jgi:PAS domain S-box
MLPLKNAFRQLSLKAKIRFYVLSITGLILLAVSVYLTFSIKAISKKSAMSITDEIVLNHAKDITKNLSKDISFASSLSSTSKFYLGNGVEGKDSLMKTLLLSMANDNLQYKSVWITLEYASIDPSKKDQMGRKVFAGEMIDGKMTFTVEDRDVKGFDSSSLYGRIKANPTLTVVDPYIDVNAMGQQSLVTSVVAPVTYHGVFAGVAGVDFSLSSYAKLTDEIKPYPGTLAFVFTSNGYIVSHSDASLIGKLYSDVGKDAKKQQEVVECIKQGKSMKYDEDINGVSYYTSIVPISIGSDGKNWALGISIPKNEIYREANRITLIAALLCLIGLISIVISTSIFSKRMTVPIGKLTQAIKKLAKGEISEANKLDLTSKDEIGEMADSVNGLIDGLKETAKFAENIGRGELNAGYSPLSENDLLGKSLLDMRSSLMRSKEEEEKRKVEDEKHAWATDGIAKFAELLRENNHDIKELSFSIIKNLVKYLGIVQGGMFILNDADAEDVYLEMTACFAYDRRKLHESRIEIGEGLVGRCFYEREPIYLREIPQDYINITSGLGDSRPSSLLLIPLKLNDVVNGVIELASLNPIEEYKVSFVEKVAESIASTLSSVRINIRTSELLVRTQQQAEEMAAQEEEMRQNLEELTSTQEEMARVREEEAKVQEELSKEKALFTNFLDSVPDLVFFKDLDGRFMKVSKFLLKSDGWSSDTDILGKTNFELFDREHSLKAYADEQSIIETGQGMHNLIEKKVQSDGSVSWISASKMPLHDANGAIIGTFGISRDITSLKLLEEDLQKEKEKNEEYTKLLEKLKLENLSLKQKKQINNE